MAGKNFHHGKNKGNTNRNFPKDIPTGLTMPVSHINKGNKNSSSNINVQNNIESEIEIENNVTVGQQNNYTSNETPNDILGKEIHPKGNIDLISKVTSETLTKLQKEVVDHYAQNFVWPKIKFFMKLDDDPDLIWNIHPKSLCQNSLAECNICSDNGDITVVKRAWLTIRKLIYNKIRTMRADKTTAIQKAFFGK